MSHVSAITNDLPAGNKSESGLPATAHAPFRFRAWHGLTIVYAVLAGLLAWTWCATADILIDFGRELYVPWQIVEGKILYQDIAYFNGPLSPMFNALLFRLFGVSVVTLLAANTIVLLAIVLTLYAQLIRYFSVLTVTVACVSMVVIFGVPHMTSHGNYNFLSPYSHELTHGMLLAVLIFSLLRFESSFRLWKWALVGVLWGLVFLGKSETFLAVTMMIACSVGLPVLRRDWKWQDLLLRVVTIFAFGLVPLIGFWLMLGRQTGLQEAGLNLLGSWRYIFGSNVTDQFFYRHMTGMLAPGRNIMDAFWACLSIAAVLFGLFAFDRNLGGTFWARSLAAASLLISFRLSGSQAIILHDRAFLIVALLLAAILLYRAIRSVDHDRRNRHLACWAIFAICMLFKMILRPRLLFYGFALLMPVTLLAIAMAIEWLPAKLFNGQGGKRFRLGLIALVLFDTSLIAAKTLYHSSHKDYVLGSGADRFRCESDQGESIQQATDYLSSRMRPDETLLVLPEGITLNYLLKRESPSPYVNFMPPELVMYGEDNIVSRFNERPGDYILLVSRTLDCYGKHHFGQPGYGDRIMQWVRENYELEQQFGSDPLEPPEFGVQVFKLRELNTARNDTTLAPETELFSRDQLTTFRSQGSHEKIGVRDQTNAVQ